jgi:hypothetical protein
MKIGLLDRREADGSKALADAVALASTKCAAMVNSFRQPRSEILSPKSWLARRWLRARARCLLSWQGFECIPLDAFNAVLIWARAAARDN